MIKHYLIASVFLCIFSISAQNAEKIPVDYFACYSNSFDTDISPDGKYVAVVTSPKENICDIEEDKVKKVEDNFRGGKLSLINLDTNEVKVLTTGEGTGSVGNIRWATNNRIIFSTYPTGKAGEVISNYALWSMNIDGSKKKKLAESQAGAGGYVSYSVTGLLPEDKNHIIMKINDRRPKVNDYYKVNILTGKRTLIARGPDVDREAWLAGEIEDSQGRPQAVIVNFEDKWRVFRYLADSNNWELHHENTCQEPSFFPMAVSGEKWIVSGQNTFETDSFNAENDKNKLYLYDPADKSFELLYEDPKYDVGGLTGGCRPSYASAIFDDKNNELLGLTYLTEKVTEIFFDQELQQQYALLKSQFPDSLVRPSSWDKDKKRIIFSVSSSTNPGDVYYFDRDKSQILYLWGVSPWLDRGKLSPMETIKFVARDGLEINGYLTLPLNQDGPFPLIMHPHGGPNVRDTYGYDDYVQFLASRGYAVLQINFRGSTGYGANHYMLGNWQWGKTMQDDISDAVAWAIEQGYADPKRVGIFGASYGGYATMAGLTFTPELYAAGINLVGVVDQGLLLEQFGTRGSSRSNGWYHEGRIEWGSNETEEGKKYIAESSPSNFIDNIKAPVFVIHGSQDRTVPIEQARVLKDLLEANNKEYEWLIEPYEGHGFTGELAVKNMFIEVERFLAQHL
jgi:dipeptidyl aminopeptidase/acylaminoacyl peptidase